MSADALWLRLNVDWHLTDWLIPLSAEAKLCWIMMICYCKTHGNKRGDVPAKSSLAFSRYAGIGEESVEQCRSAAKMGGALIERDGLWVFATWPQYQSPGAERMRRHRDDETCASQGVTERHRAHVLSRDSNSKRDSSNSNLVPDEGISIPSTKLAISQAKCAHSLKEIGEFWERFVVAYPKRKGDRKAAKGKEKFTAIVKSGVDPEVIIAGAKRYHALCQNEQKIGTSLIQQFTTFLNGRAWEEPFDCIPEPGTGYKSGKAPVKFYSPDEVEIL